MPIVTVPRALGGTIFITVASPAVLPVPRVFGGTIFVTLPPPPAPPINCTMIARKGTVTMIARKP